MINHRPGQWFNVHQRAPWVRLGTLWRFQLPRLSQHNPLWPTVSEAFHERCWVTYGLHQGNDPAGNSWRINDLKYVLAPQPWWNMSFDDIMVISQNHKIGGSRCTRCLHAKLNNNSNFSCVYLRNSRYISGSSTSLLSARAWHTRRAIRSFLKRFHGALATSSTS